MQQENFLHNNFSSISLGIASPDDILNSSFGEVRNAETVNYRTFKPERDGLFCARIFGPVKDYECLCGKYKRIKYKGIICDKCEVTVTLSKVRRERMGHIEMFCPIVHLWFLKSQPSRISNLLNLTLKEVERVVYYDSYIVIDPSNTSLNRFQVLTDKELNEALDAFGESFKYGIGGEGIRNALSSINIDDEIASLEMKISSTKSAIKLKNYHKKLKIFFDLKKTNNRAEWMVMTRIPVLPPDLRPLVMLDGGRFASSDLNELYRRVINRNNRLKRLSEIGAPDIIIRNEKRMLQESVDVLLYNSTTKAKAAKNAQNKPLKSLTDNLKGKNGRFRQNLLGKRVDYSGRSVIVVGPNLKLHECGIPKMMAVELFKPFILAKMNMYGMISSLKSASKMVDFRIPEVMEILEEITKEHLVLLNRAPTLHRLGIQAFEPKVIETKAIQLHPLVCKAFNADFDGDQMAVHIPISIESQIEARVLMLSSNNVLSPADGTPMISPSKDIIQGLYYATSLFENSKSGDYMFASVQECIKSLELGHIKYDTLIKCRISNGLIVESNLGRLMVYDIAKSNGYTGDFDIFNTTITSKVITKLVSAIYDNAGQKACVIFCDKIMQFGFRVGTESGISFGKDDIVIPHNKWDFIDKSTKIVSGVEEQFNSGYITSREKYNKVTDEWSKCTDAIAKEMMNSMYLKRDRESMSSVAMMIESGARGSEAQLKQMAGMRGLMIKPSGEVIENPIVSNFKEGLGIIEYFNSAHGSRKGVADTALRTADAGYLTRRLVDIAQDCSIVSHDCETREGLTFRTIISEGKIMEKLSEIVFGRVIAENLVDGKGNILIKAGDIIDATNADILDSIGVGKFRSPITCSEIRGICAKCYGLDRSRKSLVSIGEAVGVMAAQSIGEPGTQLTLRTFQIGGISSATAGKSSAVAGYSGLIKFDRLEYITNSANEKIVVTKNSKLLVTSDTSAISEYPIPYGSKLQVSEGDFAQSGSILATWDWYSSPIISEKSGYIKFVDLIEGVSFKEKIDESTGISNKVVLDWTKKTNALLPRIVIMNDKGNIMQNDQGVEISYIIPFGAIISTNDGDKVDAGDAICRVYKNQSSIGDITGGLPIVESIFEARPPKKPAVVAPFDGRISIDKDSKLKVKICVISSSDDSIIEEYSIKKGRYILAQDGSIVKRGDVIVDGDPDMHDILKTSGIEALSHYILKGIQDVYKLQGIRIDNKHIEIIVKYMINKVKVIDPGESDLKNDDIISIQRISDLNAKLLSASKAPIQYVRVLYGITKASINTDSFISSAAFQETVKVLTSAAFNGAKDDLIGCKENIIIGRLIPVGTGKYVSDLMKKKN